MNTRPKTGILCVGVVGIAGALWYSNYRVRTRYDGTENYAIDYPTQIKGWEPLPRTPDMLFGFRNHTTGLILHGACSQVISAYNPTPDMDTDSMAQFYIDRTQQNMKNWKAKRDPDMAGKNVRFSVIERTQKAHTVLTAFVVKGNTTLLVSMSTRSDAPAKVQEAVSALSDYVKDVGLNLQDMGGGKNAEAN